MERDARPRQMGSHQKSLFPQSLAELCAEAGTAVAELELWHARGWIGFQPDPRTPCEPYERAEVLLVSGLVAAGLPCDSIEQLLAMLEKPYQYPPEHTAYNFSLRSWMGIPADPHDVVQENWEEYLETLLREENFEELRAIRDSAQRRLDLALDDAKDRAAGMDEA